MKFRKKPIVIEAFQWTGDRDQVGEPEWIVDAINKQNVFFSQPGTPEVTMMIQTLEGTMEASRGDWIIRGMKGELYPCKPDIFEATYEPVAPTP